MTSKMFRVHLVYSEAEEDEVSEEQIIMDMQIDSETHMWTGPTFTLGFFGTINADLYPFVIKFDGTDRSALINYGDFNDQEGQERINMSSNSISLGSAFTYWDEEGDTYTYKVKNITDLTR